MSSELAYNYFNHASILNESAITTIKDNYFEESGLLVPSGTPPAGWSHDLNGVANANIAKVNGVAIANIAKINGIA